MLSASVMVTSFSSSVASSQTTVNTDFPDWINLENDTDEPVATVVREQPTNVQVYGAAVFEIHWDKLRFSSRELVESGGGTIGYRILHCRQRGGPRVANVWEFGTDLVYCHSAGEKTLYWLCHACHILGRFSNSLLTASGFSCLL